MFSPRTGSGRRVETASSHGELLSEAGLLVVMACWLHTEMWDSEMASSPKSGTGPLLPWRGPELAVAVVPCTLCTC
jgi:hypothetical protein